jgi:hypothetical protein
MAGKEIQEGMKNMTDTELMALAAKAINYSDAGDWNPLGDDEQAFRLAVTLGLDINVYKEEVGAVRHHYHGGESYRRHFVRIGDDKFAATRRAIVLVAAEMGAAK